MGDSAAGRWITSSPDTPELATAIERPTSYASDTNIQEVREELILDRDCSEM
jgi:hypothetical protein